MASQSKCNARTYPLSLIPYPLLVEKGGKFFARWSRDEALMRSRNRSILERPDRIETVDGDHTVLVDHYLHQGRWRAIGTFPLKTGAKLAIVPRASTVAGTLFADGIAIEPVD